MRNRVIVMVAGLLVAAAAVAGANRFETIPTRASFETFPMQIGEWQGTQRPPMSPEVLGILGLTDYVTRFYTTRSGDFADLYVGYWKSQRQGETIHSPQNCLPGAGWEPVSQSIINVPDPRNEGAEVPMNRYVIQKGLDRQVALYWYQSHGRIVASEYWSKAYLIADAVRLNRTDGALVRVIAPVKNDTPESLAHADEVALKFARDLLPHLDGFLPN